MDALVSHLNTNKDFFWFVKSVRKSLVSLSSLDVRSQI